VLLYNLREEESTFLNNVLRPAGVRPAGLSRVELTEAMIELVKAGMGVSVMARWAVAPHVRAGSVITLPITAGGVKRRWSAMYRVDGSNDVFLADFAKRIALDAFPVRETKVARIDSVKRERSTPNGNRPKKRIA
jgi:LysR family transcriptional regulator for metE and metH